MHETFWDLIKDPAHWMFEIVLIFIFDGLIGLIIWPQIKKRLVHHRSDDQKLEELQKQMKAVQKHLGIKS
jgi:hypothetical protein